MKNEVLYFQCFSGISGDMTVGALLDLGANKDILLSSLNSLNLHGYSIEIGQGSKCGIVGCDFNVVLESDKHHDHNHDHDHEHKHDHDHDHRNIKQIKKIIDESGITENAKKLAKRMFQFVAEAEAKAHGLPIDEVHFHEVGAVDSIVDIVAVAVCIDNLGVEKVAVSPLYEGQGHVHCQHGTIPVPVPAVLNIAKASGIQLKITETKGEMVTPTGIAIVATLKTENHLPENYTIKNIGIGTGKKDFEKANILRVMLLEVEEESSKNEVVVLESNIDDTTPEALSFTMELLFENGAKDVFFTPIVMKKNRMATMLSVICEKDLVSTMEDIIFINLPTIGIRKHTCERTVLVREEVEIDTPYGKCKYKVCSYKNRKTAYPEYESVKEIAIKNNIGFDQLYTKLKNQGV